MENPSGFGTPQDALEDHENSEAQRVSIGDPEMP